MVATAVTLATIASVFTSLSSNYGTRRVIRIAKSREYQGADMVDYCSSKDDFVKKAERIKNSFNHHESIFGIETRYNMVPLGYKISFDFTVFPKIEDFSKNQGFLGNVTIILKVIDHTDVIFLNSRNLNYTSAEMWYIDRAAKKRYKIPLCLETYHKFEWKQSFWNQSLDLYAIEIPMTLAKGEYTLNIEYEGFINVSSRSGIHYFKGNEHLLPNKYILTQFQTAHARKAFPCFDVPYMKSYFESDITFSDDRFGNGTIAVSNGRVTKTKLLRNGKKRVFFERSNYMSPYLNAWIVGPWHSTPKYTTESGTDITLYAKDEDAVKALIDFGYAEMAGDIVIFMEKLTGFKYNGTKLDLFGGLGGMENWGLISIYEALFPNTKSYKKYYSTMDILVHEIIHQWFGNLITCDNYRSVWINEGTTTYFTLKLIRFIGYPDDEDDRYSIHEVFYRIISTQTIDSSYDSYMTRPMHNTVLAINSKGTLLMEIGYMKGATLHWQIENILNGKSNTFGGKYMDFIRALLRRYQWQSLSTFYFLDLLDTFEYDTDELVGRYIPLGQLMKIYCTKTGLPLLRLNRTYTDSQYAEIYQLEYRIDPEDIKNNRRPLPITSYNQGEKPNLKMKWIMGPVSKDVFPPSLLPKDDKWIILNVNLSGYFMVDYDDKNWDMIIDQLIEDPFVIPELNRADILNTLLLLKKRKQLLRIANYIGRETSAVISKSFQNGFDVCDPSECNEWKVLLVDPLYERLLKEKKIDFFKTNPVMNKHFGERRFYTLIAKMKCTLELFYKNLISESICLKPMLEANERYWNAKKNNQDPSKVSNTDYVAGLYSERNIGKTFETLERPSYLGELPKFYPGKGGTGNGTNAGGDGTDTMAYTDDGTQMSSE